MKSDSTIKGQVGIQKGHVRTEWIRKGRGKPGGGLNLLKEIGEDRFQ